MAEQLGKRLFLDHTCLTPVDSLAIDYFLSFISLTASSAKMFSAFLSSCSLGDAGIKSLLQNISKNINIYSKVTTYFGNELWDV